MEEDVKQRLKSREVWVRALYMLFFAIVSVVARAVITLLVIVQFVIVLVTGYANQRLLELGQSLAAYVYQIIRFVTFNTETLPFPFSPWPDETAEGPGVDDDEPAAPNRPSSPSAGSPPSAGGSTGAPDAPRTPSAPSAPSAPNAPEPPPRPPRPDDGPDRGSGGQA